MKRQSRDILVKFLIIISIISVMLLLCACGKSEAVQAVEKSISEIGNVTLDSEEVIVSVEEEFNTLSDDEQKTVSNRNILQAARDTLDQLKEEEAQRQFDELRKSLCGQWVELYGHWVIDGRSDYDGYSWESQGKTNLKLEEDGLFEYNGIIGEWYLSESKDFIVISTSEKMKWNLLDDEGVKKLQFNNAEITLVKAEEYSSLAEKMFIVAELTPDNVEEYMQPSELEEFESQYGESAGKRLWLKNEKYEEESLSYLGFSNNFSIQFFIKSSYMTEKIEVKFPFPKITIDKSSRYEFKGFGEVRGSITYARPEYVVSNEYDDGVRAITFKDGTVIKRPGANTP